MKKRKVKWADRIREQKRIWTKNFNTVGEKQQSGEADGTRVRTEEGRENGWTEGGKRDGGSRGAEPFMWNSSLSIVDTL